MCTLYRELADSNDFDIAGETPVESAPSGQDLVDALAASGKLDELFASIDAGGVQPTGKGGVVPALIRAALERGLQVELIHHLGYEKGAPRGAVSPTCVTGRPTRRSPPKRGTSTWMCPETGRVPSLPAWCPRDHAAWGPR